MEGKVRLVAIPVGVVAALALLATPAGAAFPGTNGKIVFESHQAGTLDDEIFVMDPDGQNPARLTQNEVNDEDAAFSADGEKIAWSAPRPGDIIDDEIWVMDADGQNQVPLTDNGVSENRPAYSPDGKHIVYSRFENGDSEVFVMDADGQNQVPLTDNSVGDGDAVFSPDGTQIAFSSTRDGDSDIYVMDADGQNQVPLTDDPANDGDPAFSPDGERIAFETSRGGDREIFVMNANGESELPLTQNSLFDDEDPAFSPDGQRIAFTTDRDGDPEIFAMDSNGQNQAPLTSNSASDAVPDWQPLNPPALDLSAQPTQKSAKLVTVTVISANENATAELAGTVMAKKASKGAAIAKSKTFALAPQSIELQPAQPVTVQLAIPKKARKLLKKGFAIGKKGKATVTAEATDDLGASSQEDERVKLKKRRKEK